MHVYEAVTGLLSTKQSSLTPRSHSKTQGKHKQDTECTRIRSIWFRKLKRDGFVRDKVGNSTFGKGVPVPPVELLIFPPRTRGFIASF